MGSIEEDRASHEGVEKPDSRAKKPTVGNFEAILRSGPDLSDIAIVKTLLESEDPVVRDRAAEYFPKLWKVYRADQGAEIRAYQLGQHAPWGIALFWNGHFDWDYRAESAGLAVANWEMQLQQCAQAISEANEILTGSEKIVIQGQLYTLVYMLFTSLDVVALNPESKAAKDRMDESVAFAEKRRKEIDAKVREIGLQRDRRLAQQSYLLGMFPGLALIAAVLAPIAVYTKIGLPTVATISAGSIGAILSVLSRTTRAQVANSLDIDFQVGRGLIFFAGLFRPIVGALLAAALYVLISAGIIPLKIPGPPEKEFFFTAIAFLAGFSERLAQDALVRTSRATFLLSSTSEGVPHPCQNGRKIAVTSGHPRSTANVV